TIQGRSSCGPESLESLREVLWIRTVAISPRNQDSLAVQLLEPVAEHWPIHLREYVGAQVDAVVGVDAKDVLVVRRVVNPAECEPVRNLGQATLVTILQDMRGIQQRWLAKPTHRALVRIRIEYKVSEPTLMQTMPYLPGDIDL